MPDVVPANTENHIACRHNCAYNLPAMTAFCSIAGKVDYFIHQLYSTFKNLARDPYFMIRQTVACGLYEVTVSLTLNLTVLSLTQKPACIRYFTTVQLWNLARGIFYLLCVYISAVMYV
jgi:hypothetical protein